MKLSGFILKSFLLLVFFYFVSCNYFAYASDLEINAIGSSSKCEAKINYKTYPCMLGRSGVTKDKKEGDGATPYGEYSVRRVFFRQDRIGGKLKKISLPIQALQKNDGWCDDVHSSEYNKYVKLPFSYSYEDLWRDDPVYDIIGVVGYNDDPVVKEKGSAIFLHVMFPDKRPTSGCISFEEKDLIAILSDINAQSKVIIH